ncbi:MAG: hypothetical protein ABH873_08540 [Candidatus Firestonebacteria bacterium]
MDRIFLAIPSKGFGYKYQKDILKKLCGLAGYEPYTLEDDNNPQKKIEKVYIEEQIKNSQYFVADLSSGRPNIALELGWAMKLENIKGICKIISSIEPLFNQISDLQGENFLIYKSFGDLQKQFTKWLIDNVKPIKDGLKPYIEDENLNVLDSGSNPTFKENFSDYQSFSKDWVISPSTVYGLTSQGLLISGGLLPVMTRVLLAEKYIFKMDVRIVNKYVGICFHGSISSVGIPSSFYMLNLDLKQENNNLTVVPHIFVNGNYYKFKEKNIQIILDDDSFMNLYIEAKGPLITLKDSNNLNKNITFNFIEYGNRILPTFQSGNIGFRCSGYQEDIQGCEKALIRKVELWIKS